MALATLSIDIEARLAKLEEGMTRATRIAEKNAAQIEARFRKIGDVVRNVAGIIGVAWGANLLSGFTRNVFTGIDALNDLKDATGASIENLSALEDIAARTGTRFDTVQSSLVRFNKVLLDAKAGSEYANILKAIGLSAEALRKADPVEALRQTAVALARYADDGNKARIISALFGKSVAEVAPLLNDLAKQSELVATVTTREAEAVEEFNQRLFALQKNVVDVARSIVGEIVPALNTFFEKLKQGQRSTGWFASIGDEFKANILSDQLTGTVNEIVAIQKAIDRQGATPWLTNRLAGLREEASRLSRELDATNDKLKKFAPAAEALKRRPPNEGGGKFVGLPAPDVSGIGADKTAKVKREFETFADDVNKSLSKMIEGSDLVKLETLNAQLARLEELAAAGLDPRIVDQVRGLLGAERGVGPDIEADVLEKRNRLEKELNDLRAATPTAKLERQRELMQALVGATEQAIAEGKDASTAWAEFGEVAQTALGTLPEQWEKTTDKMNEFTLEAARNIQDALGDTVLRTLKGDFDSIGRLWGDLIQRLIAQALSANLAELLMGDFAKTKKVGGLFGDFISLFQAKGGVFQGGVQTFARGGVVSSPHLFPMANGMGLMGEAGPEAIMPLRRGRDGKLGVASDGGGGLTIINNVSAGVTRSEVLAALQLTAQSLRGEFKQSLRMAGVA